MKKKLFTLLLAVAASVGTMFAESGTCGTNLTWDLTDGVLTISGTGAMKDYDYRNNSPWYKNRSSITSVTIGTGVTSIGDDAFNGCSSLTSVTIPNSVTSIGIRAFIYCGSLTSVTIGNSVTSIGEQAFCSCNRLNSITIPNSVTSIGVDAFYECSSLTSVTIPNSVTSIGGSAFYGCTGLTSVTIGNSVTSIGEDVFYNCSSLTSVTIPNSVTSIGDDAFYGCSSLTSVTIPNSVTSIGDRAFASCSSLTSVTIPNSVTCIGGSAFYLCSSLTSPVYNAHVFAFMPTSYSGAFTIPDGIESIAVGAFDDCISLTSVTIPNSVTSIGGAAFRKCSRLTSIDIPNSVTSIEHYAFQGCGLTSVTIPNSVTSIGICAFNGCTGLTSVTIGNSVTSIENSAFYYCTGLTSITIEAETPPTLVSYPWVDEDTFGNTNNCPIYVPCNAVNAYKAAWSNYANRIRGNCASSYTVRFLNWDGSVLQSTQVEEGQMPQYTGATPTKPSDSQYSYTFSGWTPQIVAATADATYTATYKSVGIHNITVRLDPSSCSSWSTVRLWAWTDAGDVFDSWPGQVVGKDIDGWYSYTFDEDITSVNIIWNNGTDQTVNIDGVTSSTCYALNSTTGTTITARVVDCVTGQPLGHANESTTTDVTATPNEDNSVTLTWPAVNGADTYTIEIKKNGVSVCTLVFNAKGQLISINFAAPARDGKGRNVPAAEQSANGWTYIVTGLEENASYTYSVTAKDVNGNVLLKQSVDFSTGGAQGIEDVLSDQVQCTKVIREGHIFILRGDKTYTVMGQEVK